MSDINSVQAQQPPHPLILSDTNSSKTQPLTMLTAITAHSKYISQLQLVHYWLTSPRRQLMKHTAKEDKLALLAKSR